MNEKEKFNVIGSPENNQYAQGYLNGARETVLKPMEDELPKTKTEIAFMQKVNDLLQAAITDLGLVEKPKFDIRQVHIFSVKVFKEKFALDDCDKGLFCSVDGRITIARVKKRSHLFKAIMHEMIHNCGYFKFAAREQQAPIVSRSGYLSTKPNDIGHSHFQAFDELVIEKIAEDLLTENVDDLQQEFGIDLEQATDFGYSAKMLDSFLNLLAQKSGEEKEVIWQKIKRGYFSGEMHYLRVIDDYLGRGSLRFLAAIDFREYLGKHAGKKMAEFFLTDDQKRRDKIAWELLSEREYLRYKQQAQKQK
jgi:hypothetical protein